MSQTLSKIQKTYPDVVFDTVKGFDEAVIGLDLDTSRLIYSVTKCLDILVYTDGMHEEDAVEYFEEKMRNQNDDEESLVIWANTEF